MKKLARISTISLLVIFFYGCDPYVTSIINNNSDVNATVILKFNSETLDKAWEDVPDDYLGFIKAYPNFTNIKPGVFNKDDLSMTYTIEPGHYFPVESGASQYPNYDIFVSVTIIHRDTIVLNGPSEIAKGFTEVERRDYQIDLE